MNELELAEAVDEMEAYEREHGPTIWLTIGEMNEREAEIANAELERRGCKSSRVAADDVSIDCKPDVVLDLDRIGPL